MEFPDPTPGPGEVVVEMKASGMCGSDLHQYRRPKGGDSIGGLPVNPEPVIGGHEPCGIVAAIGPGVSEKMARVGQRVMVHHYKGCTVCDHCRSGWSQLCQEEPVAGLRQQRAWRACALSEGAGLHAGAAADELSFSTGAAISCGTGTAYGALRRMNISGNDTIAIFGQGPVGLSATQLAAAMGARVIAARRQPGAAGARQGVRRRRDRQPALQRPGRRDQGPDAWRRRLHARHVEQPEGRIAAVRSAKVWGTVCFVGERNNVTIDVSPDMLRKQLTIIGSWTFSSRARPSAPLSSSTRKIDVDRLFTHHWKLDQAEEAYRLFDTQTAGKGVFLM